MKNVLITGGTGLVGTHLSALLLKKGYNVSVLSRGSTGENDRIRYFRWDVSKQYIDKKALVGIDTIIHLAGANVGSRRWTEKRKHEILNSRIDPTKLLLQYVETQNVKPRKFISASAIGFYGAATSETIFNENADHGKDFLANVCNAWEQEVQKFGSIGVNTTILRTSVVLARNSGALPKMIFPTELGLNAPLGTGKQYMPWIHIEDLCRMYLFFLENPKFNGVFNAVATEQVDNHAFSKEISKVLKKPFFIPNIPAFFLRMAFGEMAGMLLEGSRVGNEKVKNVGFRFRHDTLNAALADLLN